MTRHTGRWRPIACFAALALAALVLCASPQAGTCLGAPGQDAAKESLEQAFLAVQSAESRGADVSQAVKALNQALALIQKGDEASIGQAVLIIEEVNSSLPRLAAEGDQRQLAASVALYSFLGGIGVTGALAYLYLPRLIWRAWARAKGGWEVSSG